MRMLNALSKHFPEVIGDLPLGFHKLVPGEVSHVGPAIRRRGADDAVYGVQLMYLVVSLEHRLFREKLQHDTADIRVSKAIDDVQQFILPCTPHIYLWAIDRSAK